jgi:hypothetical protein
MKRDLHCLYRTWETMPSMCGTREATVPSEGRLKIELPTCERETGSIR